jgi:hypothetical protein
MSTTQAMPTTSAPTPQEIAAEEAEAPVLAGYLAEFADVTSVVRAAEKVRDAGFRYWDVHSPFPIHGIDEAMNIRPTILPWIVLIAGLIGLSLALLMEWWMNSYDYPYLVSGKPFFSLAAFIPIMFECTVLFSAFAGAFAMLLLNKLPMLYNPLFKSERFRRVTTDRFFVVIDARDPKFDEGATEMFLQSLNPIAIERFED